MAVNNNLIIQNDKNQVSSYQTYLNVSMIEDFSNYVDAKPRTVKAYISNLKQFFMYIKQRNIYNPTRQTILEYRDYLKANYSAATVQSYIVALRLFFQWTELSNLYPNIAKRVKGATVSKAHKKDYLTANQMEIVLETIDRSTLTGKRDYALIALLVTCGLRTIEAHRANIEDLRTLGDMTVLYIQGKGKDEKTDYVKITPIVEKIIREYLKAKGNPAGKEPLFTSISNNSTANRLSVRSISGIVKQRLIDAGFNSDRLTAHSLRHTAVTLSLIGGNSLQEVQQFARHSNISTTQIYAHNLDRANNKCEESISGAIFG